MADEPVEWYDENAVAYSETNTELPIRKWYEWRGVDTLLPDLDGKRVLDAGCGEGTYTKRLADRGADVVGVDASDELLGVAREQYGDEIEFHLADLREPLPFDDASFDVIVTQLALDHIQSWDTALAEFHRVLEPGGHALLSVNNPPAIWAKMQQDTDDQFGLDRPSYFETERWEQDWSPMGDAEGTVGFYRRPTTAQLQPAFDAGFVLDGFEEPQPGEAFRESNPERYARWSQRPPTFVCYRLRKPE